ncbi:hypothetical protein ACFPIJ_09555 [Dactylosporangium cerinum]|uniref:Uncharacterized protein n=1 Tax=Dactylosporangium cerinum TaxID=1434730 RepID=A0ABV9VR24_9ACTN
MSQSSISPRRTVLVTGARGKTGREVVAQLRRHPGVAVREGSSQPGAETAFSWDDPDTWPGAVKDVDAVYLMRPDVPEAPEHVARLIDLNPDASVVLLSEQGADGLPAGQWARRVEDAVTGRAAGWTLLRPSWFHQVLTDPRFYRDDIRVNRVLRLPSGGAPIAWVDARDIAAVAVAALVSPAGHDRQSYTITGPEALPVQAVTDALSAHLGVAVRADDPPPGQAVEGLDAWTTDILIDLYDRVRAGGFAEQTPVVERITGRRPTSVSEFVAANLDEWR